MPALSRSLPHASVPVPKALDPREGFSLFQSIRGLSKPKMAPIAREIHNSPLGKSGPITLKSELENTSWGKFESLTGNLSDGTNIRFEQIDPSSNIKRGYLTVGRNRFDKMLFKAEVLETDDYIVLPAYGEKPDWFSLISGIKNTGYKLVALEKSALNKPNATLEYVSDHYDNMLLTGAQGNSIAMEVVDLDGSGFLSFAKKINLAD